MTTSPPTAVALFSGGLDSILAAKLIQEQGVHVVCLHFCTPFFGKPHLIKQWEKIYGLTIQPIDISKFYVDMLIHRPKYGFGSCMNPCVDCKIMMIQKAREIMKKIGACCIISGEVLGQRPMSQRRETLNIIRRDADVEDFLLRPLSALKLEPTQAERDGLIERSKLKGFSGRGRKDQLALAAYFGITEIPTPAGGCRLTEQENVRSYWSILRYMPSPLPSDFYLANLGRQFWYPGDNPFWLTIGRKQSDNDAILEHASADDLLFKIDHFPGPIALGRKVGAPWSEEAILSAAALTASYSTKAVHFSEKNKSTIAVKIHIKNLDTQGDIVHVMPTRTPAIAFSESYFASAQEALKKEAQERGRIAASKRR